MCNLKKGDEVKIWSDDYFLCGDIGVVIDDKRKDSTRRMVKIKGNFIYISENDLEKV